MDGSRRCVLLKFGELALKGRNRPRFVRALERNLRRLTADLGPIEVRHRGGVFIVSGDVPQDELVERCLRLPGVSVVQPALRCERDATAAADAAVELLRELPGRTFAVRATRRDKRFPLRSIELARLLGDAVRVRLGLEVDLSDARPRAVRRGRPQGAARVGRADARRRRAAGRDERAGAGAALGRARLAGRGLPDDEARPALRLPALLGPPVHEPGLDLQGVRAGRASSTASRAARGSTWSRSARRSGGSRPPAPGGSRCCRSGG